MNTRLLATIAAGLLGLVVAACLGYLALQLVSQPTGLSAIPARTGDDLVSASKRRAAKARAADQVGRVKSLTIWKSTSAGDGSADDHDGHDHSDSSTSSDSGHDSSGDDHDDD